jgi:hypothetical protein
MDINVRKVCKGVYTITLPSGMSWYAMPRSGAEIISVACQIDLTLPTLPHKFVHSRIATLIERVCGHDQVTAYSTLQERLTRK